MTPPRMMSTPAALAWRMPMLVRLTFLAHAFMLVALLLRPQAWPWILAAFVLNHLFLIVTGLLPRTHWLGPNWTSLPPTCAARGEIALTIDDGPDPEVTPKVLDLLDKHGVKATFFCIGMRAAQYPALCRDIVERGHTVENHSQHHYLYFSTFGMASMRRDIVAAQETLFALTGRYPQFFRAPAGLRNPFLDPVLAGLGLHLAAWTRRGYDTRTPDPERVSRRLLRDVRPGAILLMHDGNCARTDSGMPVILAVLPTLIAAAQQAGLRFVTLSHALHSSQR